LYALVTNTPANGDGGIVYRIAAVPEPATWALFALGGWLVAGLARRYKPRRTDGNPEHPEE
jgi:hypothetical protein